MIGYNGIGIKEDWLLTGGENHQFSLEQPQSLSWGRADQQEGLPLQD